LTFSGVGGRVHADYHAMWINPAEPSHMVAGTDGGVYVTHNRGGAWRHLNNLPISQFYHVSCDNEFPYNVYGGLQDNGSWTGPSRSRGGIENMDWINLGGGDGFQVLADPFDSDVVYWEYQGGNLSRLDRRTGEGKDIKPQPAGDEPPYRFNWNSPIALGGGDPARLYFGAQFLFRSSDHGESWQRISDDLTTDDPEKQRQRESGGLTVDNTTAENHCTIFTIAESRLDPDVIWAGTDAGNMQVTDNGGGSWRKVSGGLDGLPDGTWCSCVEPSGHERTTAYVTFDGHRTGDMAPHVYRTTDLGRNWESLTTAEIQGHTHVIREDPVNPNLLFLGTELGLYITLDGGKHWARFEENLPEVSVRDLMIQPREADLVLATHGRGIYIIDDISPLRQITPEVMAADVFVLESPPAILRNPQWKQHSPGDAYYVGGNPDSAAKLTYYLKKRHMFGDLYVEIFDADGNLVKKLPGGKQRGINRITWQTRLKPPKVAPSPTLDPMTMYAGMFGPLAAEGVYSYRVTKGKQTYAGQIVLQADPRSPHSAEDRALQQQTVWQLYALVERLTYVAEAVSGARDDTRARAEECAEGDELLGELTAFADDLDGFHQTLVATDERQGITGDRQLKEHLLRLYASVSLYGGRPGMTQLEQFEVFQEQIAAAENEFQTLTGGGLARLNESLSQAGLEHIELLSEDVFEAEE